MTETAPGELLPVAFTAYEDRAALARALAAHVAEALRRRIASDGRLRSPSPAGAPTLFFETLSGAPLDWAKVSVTLVDERWVPETSDAPTPPSCAPICCEARPPLPGSCRSIRAPPPPRRDSPLPMPPSRPSPPLRGRGAGHGR